MLLLGQVFFKVSSKKLTLGWIIASLNKGMSRKRGT